MMQTLSFYCGNFGRISAEEQANLEVITQGTESGAKMTQQGINLLEHAQYGTDPVRVFSNIDHVFNGLRIAMLRKCSLDAVEKVQVIYTPDSGPAVVVRLGIDGRVVGEWPDGMFDQNLKNIAELGRGRRATQR
jgi:predicted ATPase